MTREQIHQYLQFYRDLGVEFIYKHPAAAPFEEVTYVKASSLLEKIGTSKKKLALPR